MLRTTLLALALALAAGTPHLGSLLDVVVKAGNHFDPNGATTEAGGHYDPNGAMGDAGNVLDPDG
ncbi:MAG TPA: hypothetical protein VE685_22925 [Thermoanaerobaculia bacterium]|nr:hypothetical protein [Thermoanaerobaculia bacterium]